MLVCCFCLPSLSAQTFLITVGFGVGVPSSQCSIKNCKFLFFVRNVAINLVWAADVLWLPCSTMCALALAHSTCMCLLLAFLHTCTYIMRMANHFLERARQGNSRKTKQLVIFQGKLATLSGIQSYITAGGIQTHVHDTYIIGVIYQPSYWGTQLAVAIGENTHTSQHTNQLKLIKRKTQT